MSRKIYAEVLLLLLQELDEALALLDGMIEEKLLTPGKLGKASAKVQWVRDYLRKQSTVDLEIDEPPTEQPMRVSGGEHRI